LERAIGLFAISVVLFTITYNTFSLSFGEIPSTTLEIFEANTKPYDLSYEDHIKKYWQWIISIPVDVSPVNDKTGEKCGYNQLNSTFPVFYLSDGGGGKFERTCKVPLGKGLLIPLMTVEVSDKEVPNVSIEELHKIAKKDQDSVTSLYLKINNKEYLFEDLKKYRTHTTDLEVYFPKNAIFGASEGKSKVVADGYYIITKPVTKGKHTIEFKASLICPGADCLAPNFAQDVKYTVIVE
jgi:hypothetical protein